jgi:hypothetical protein
MTLGDIHTFGAYKECVLMGIRSKPELHMVPDKTRQHARHDLNISVRETHLVYRIILGGTLPHQGLKNILNILLMLHYN